MLQRLPFPPEFGHCRSAAPEIPPPSSSRRRARRRRGDRKRMAVGIYGIWMRMRSDRFRYRIGHLLAAFFRPGSGRSPYRAAKKCGHADDIDKTARATQSRRWRDFRKPPVPGGDGGGGGITKNINCKNYTAPLSCFSGKGIFSILCHFLLLGGGVIDISLDFGPGSFAVGIIVYRSSGHFAIP